MTRDAELARVRNRSRNQGPELMETRGRDFEASGAGTVTQLSQLDHGFENFSRSNVAICS
jgi:hypothetical protein